MSQLDQLRGDLSFVRSAASRASGHSSPAAIYFLWALLVMCGFVLVDVRGAWVLRYWTIAAPVGFVASAYLGWRYGLRRGQLDAGTGMRQLLHWGGTLAAAFLVLLMPATGVLAQRDAGLVILLILALGYFQAGVHLDPPFLWIGALMILGYLWILFAPMYAWTVVGVVLAIGLAAAGVRQSRRHEPAV
jgi:hypothetical protein